MARTPSVAAKPRGLVNLGNTCYFNSVMQSLLNAPIFGPLLEERNSTSEKYLLDDPSKEDQVELVLPECDRAVASLIETYRQYVDQRSSNAIAPSKLITCIRQKTGRFQRNVQEDSHELLRSLIDIVRSDEIRRQKAAISSYMGDTSAPGDVKADCFTIIDMVFGGYFLSSVQCQKCKFNSEHLEPFYDLSLAITDPINDIRSAIANFTSNAILDGDNKFICERCSKANGKKTYEAGVKSTKIVVPPNIMTLHLKRFEASAGSIFETKGGRGGLGGGRRGKRNLSAGTSGKRRGKGRGGCEDDDDEENNGFVGIRGGLNFRKINKHVQFSEFLDIKDYTSDLCYDLTKINNWPRMKRDDPIWYTLFGVVCHSGNLRSGHYTAYVKCEENIDEETTEEFMQIIQEHPYIPDLASIDKIKVLLRDYEATRCKTTDRYCGQDDDENQYQTRLDFDKPSVQPGTWYYVSDSEVRKSCLSDVLDSQAYILFYKRVIEIE